MTDFGFTIAPGTLAALSGRGDSRAHYVLTGDLSQMGTIYLALRDAGFPVVKTDIYPGFPEDDEESYIRALYYVFTRRVPGWWNQKEALLRYRLCTEDEFRTALRVTASSQETI